MIELESCPIGLVCVSAKEIYVGMAGNIIHLYNIKGKKQCSMHLDSPITNMELFTKGKMEQTRALLVALKNGEIRLYKKRKLINVIQTHVPGSIGGVDEITGIRCGRYGREDVCLSTTHRSGSMCIRIHRRTAKLNFGDSDKKGPPEEQDVPLNLPKKTRLYVEQAQREREQAIDMHRIFQRDLSKLRLASAQSYVKLITDGNGLISRSRQASVRLTAQVQGLGPLFKMQLHVQNLGRHPLQNVIIAFGYPHNLYQMPVASIRVPVLLPSVLYQYEATVHSVDSNGAAGNET